MFHGKEGVSGSSPEKGSTKTPHPRGFVLLLSNAIRGKSHQDRTRLRARLPNRLLRGDPLGAVELIETCP
jgi:hypothetical protein